MKTLLVEQQQHILKITLNRPEVRNAFAPPMIQELTKTFKSAAKQKDLRAVVIAGAGESFCAGADLQWMKSMAQYTRAQNVKDAEKLYTMFQMLRDCPVPVITRAQGHVMGGALGLLAVSDLVVAEESTVFCFSEAKLGLSPAVISAFVKDRVPASEMSRWFLTADPFSASQAQAMGLVHEVKPAAELDSQVLAWAKSLLNNGPTAVLQTKQLLRRLPQLKNDRQLRDYTAKLIAQLRVGDEGQEGLQSFFEKTKPSWRTS